MSFLSYIFPQEIYRGSSKFSSDIRVVEDMGSLRLVVNGIEQSGKHIDKILTRAFDACRFSPDVKRDRMLLLGVGGGSLIRLFRTIFPDITIDAVDIDAVIISVAEKYFGLSAIRGLKIYNSDALRFVKDHIKNSRQKYGIIVVDIYIGRDIPDFVWERPFLEDIHSLLTPSGFVFMNVVHDGKYEESVKTLKHTLSDIFSGMKEIPVDYNTFFLATK
jgi:spermidine synthase